VGHHRVPRYRSRRHVGHHRYPVVRHGRHHRYPAVRHFRHGHGHHYRHGGYWIDDEVFIWIGLTAIGLKLLDVYNDEQARQHEQAHQMAATAPIGQSIVWNADGASGVVTPIREGTDDAGNLCREFEQEIRIDGRRERALGTACLQQDGTWVVVN
jgi:hypothetical protein